MNDNKEAMKLALEALTKLTDAAEGFSVSGVYFNEGVWEKECLNTSYATIKALEEALAKQEQGEQDNYQGSDAAKAAHMMDLYTALGVKWGEDPFAVIAKMRSIAETEKQERPTGPATSADRYFYDAGFEAGRLAGIKITLDEWAKSEPPVLAKQEQGEPVDWTPDRSGKYLTVVYRDVVPGDEVGAIVEHPKCVIMSWSNAVHDVDYLRNRLPPQRKPLTDEQRRAIILKADTVGQAIAMVETAHGIKE